MIIDIINWPVIADFCNTHVAVYHNDLESEVELIHVSLHVNNLKAKMTFDKIIFRDFPHLKLSGLLWAKIKNEDFKHMFPNSEKTLRKLLKI